MLINDLPTRKTRAATKPKARLVRSAGATLALLALASFSGRPAHADLQVDQDNLVTDNQSVNSAQITDPNLQNPWGVSFSPTSPFWISDNNDGLSTLYAVNPTTNAVTKESLTVTIPPGGGNGSPTGQVNNTNTGAFHGDNFLFVSEDGTISGWRGALGTTAETFVPASDPNTGAVYKGSALATPTGTVTQGATTLPAGTEVLYAANFRAGTVDVFTAGGAAAAVAAQVTLQGTFTDPNIPAGYAPFNIQKIGNNLYVSYALQDAAKHDDVAGAGNGYVDEYDLNGNLIARIATRGTLDSPWGMTIAPASYGSLAGDLLVGNFGDGEISAFNLTTDTFAGVLDNPNGTPLTIPGLWDITPGNNGNAGSSQDIYFTAGPNDETDGVFGVLTNAPEPASLSVLGVSLVGTLLARRRRSRPIG